MEQRIHSNMLESSSLFYDCMRVFYNVTNDGTFPLSFEEIMESNENRLDYIICALEKIDQIGINEELLKTLKSTVTYIYAFITKGVTNKTISMPSVYASNSDISSIIPSEKDLNFLFDLISLINIIYEEFYENKKLKLALPNETFNQGMTRIIEIERKNLPHLMGLTESVNKPNYLRKLFIEKDKEKNKEHYDDDGNYIDEEKTIAERLLDYILTDEGKKDIIDLNNKVLSFKEKDMLTHPDAYDEFGNIKLKSLPSFKERLKQETNLDFPIIKYSRYITKCVNLANFLNMYNLYEMVLDYRGVEKLIRHTGGERDIKDLFLVNSPQHEISHFISVYKVIHDFLFDELIRYAKSESDYEKDKIEKYLKSHGIDIQKHICKEGIDSPLKTFLDFNKQDHLIDESIDPDFTSVHKIIDDALQNEFIKSVYMLGFDSAYQKDDQRNSLDIIPLDEESMVDAHCDTSISVNVVDLISRFHKYGRAFFIDKIMNEEGKCLRISRPIEEINYKKISSFLKEKEEDTKSLEVRLNILDKVYEEFLTYIDSIEFGDANKAADPLEDKDNKELEPENPKKR